MRHRRLAERDPSLQLYVFHKRLNVWCPVKINVRHDPVLNSKVAIWLLDFDQVFETGRVKIINKSQADPIADGRVADVTACGR